MSSSRYLVVGVVTRRGGRWAVRRRFRPWSPTRALVLAVLALLPTRVLGFLTWQGIAWYVGKRLDALKRPAPALLIVALAIGLLLNRDRLPAAIDRRLPA